MIKSIHIKNYKSIQDLSVDFGRFNVIIGENGCGKSNILEAIALAAAAESKKLDNEFLTSRGVRITSPTTMRSAFTTNTSAKSINIDICYNGSKETKRYKLQNKNLPYSKWTSESTSNRDIAIFLEKLLIDNPDFAQKVNAKQILDSLKKDMESTNELLDQSRNNLKDFIIYSPENSALRNFYKEGQVEPLGVNGEGLLKLLRTINEDSDSASLNDIVGSLNIFDWFKSLEIPINLAESEDSMKISDRYLVKIIDQRSANEGFLFVLFYITLFVSKETPRIFAIDNIDASLNPKLCSELIKKLTSLAKKYDKQVFVTTHNPGILDGIDLGDDEQRLLVASRNKKGHTKYKRIKLEDKPKSSAGEPLRLSEALLRGYIGGLPKGF